MWTEQHDIRHANCLCVVRASAEYILLFSLQCSMFLHVYDFTTLLLNTTEPLFSSTNVGATRSSYEVGATAAGPSRFRSHPRIPGKRTQCYESHGNRHRPRKVGFASQICLADAFARCRLSGKKERCMSRRLEHVGRVSFSRLGHVMCQRENPWIGYLLGREDEDHVAEGKEDCLDMKDEVDNWLLNLRSSNTMAVGGCRR